MSVDKLLQQSEKLLDKGKHAEAILKLQEAFKIDGGNNELVANKLARTLAEVKRIPEAIAIYKQVGAKAASAGKSQKAVALFKQGIDIDPQNLELLERIAPECEAIGKLTEAASYAQRVLGFYVPRKRYLDALNSFALVAKVQPNDEGVRLAWLELLMYARNEMQLRKALICFSGPPGLQMNEMPVGGDPTKISPALYNALVALLPFYPGEPMLPYALAWISYRQDRFTDAYRFLYDCFGKDQNFCLAILLFSRLLAEKERLGEALFVYQYAKDRQALDRSIDKRALQQQYDAFEEKNGWMNFAEGLGSAEENSPAAFLAKFVAEVDPAEENNAEGQEEAESDVPDLFGTNKASASEYRRTRDEEDEPQVQLPAEVELGGAVAESESSMVIQFGGEPTKIFTQERAQAALQQETIKEKEIVYVKETLVAAPPGTAVPIPSSALPPTAARPSAIPPVARAAPPVAPAPPSDPVDEGDETVPADEESPAGEPTASLYSAASILPEEPLTLDVPEEAELPKPADDATKLFSPIDLLDTQKQQQQYRRPKYRKVQSTSRVDIQKPPVGADDAATQMFSATALRDAPVGAEVVDLGDDLLKEPTQMLTKQPEEQKILVPETFAPAHVAEEASETAAAEIAPQSLQAEAKPTYKQLLRDAAALIRKKRWPEARRVLRAAQNCGADPALVAQRLAQIRELSQRTPLFSTESQDSPDTRTAEQILRELEFEVGASTDADEADVRQVEEALSKIRDNIDTALLDSDPRVRLDLGIAFLEMGIAKEAEVQFRRAVELDAGLKGEASYLTAQSLLKSKDFPGAISLLKEIAGDPRIQATEKLPALYLMGEVYSEMNQPKRARRCFEQVANLDENYRSVKEKLGRP